MISVLLYLIVVQCALFLCSSQLQFPLPNVPLARPPTLQVDAEGRAFVAAGNQLMRLSSDLLPQGRLHRGGKGGNRPPNQKNGGALPPQLDC